MKFLKKSASAAGVATLCALGLLGGPNAVAQNPQAPQVAGAGVSPVGRQNVELLNSCLSANKKADMLFVLDESASLRGQGGPATDPEDVRVAATRDLVKQLSRLSEETGAEINAKLAGFSQGYRSDVATYGDWTSVSQQQGALDKHIDEYKSREDGQYTVYGDALGGAMGDISAHADPQTCKVVLFFTDGLLTVPGDEAADQAARQAMCSPQSPVRKLRDSGIQLFSVGLIPQNEQSPEALLRGISEDDACVPGTKANGAFFNAQSNPAALFAAFRSLLPLGAGIEQNSSVTEPFRFVLDDSITDIRVSAQPTGGNLSAELVPYLKSPAGEEVELREGPVSLGEQAIRVETTPSAPGMVDVSMEKTGAGAWAGTWEFGYRAPENSDASYHASMQIFPGLRMVADRLEGPEGNQGLSSDEGLGVRLVDRNGQPRSLEGNAMLTAEFVPTTGAAPIRLSDPLPIRDGKEVVVPLDQVKEPASGTIVLTTAIETKNPDGGAGTLLSPVVASYNTAITPVNMPKLAGNAKIAIEEKETRVVVKASGAGSLSLAPQEFGEDGVLPNGVDKLALSSPHSSPESALRLQEGESAEFPIDIVASSLADGPVAITPAIELISAEGNQQASLDMPMTGSMRVPVNAEVFTGVLIIALLLALLIPLALLYAIKFLTGRIPSRPGIHSVRIPVIVKNSELYREDTGGRFELSFDDTIGASPRQIPDARGLNVCGQQLSVRFGWNPFAPAQVVADTPDTISDAGRQRGNHAVLPLAIHNHWFVALAPAHEGDVRGSIYVMLDETISRQRIAEIGQKIAQDAPERLRRLQDNAGVDVASDGAADGVLGGVSGGFAGGSTQSATNATEGFGRFGDFSDSQTQGGFGSFGGNQQSPATQASPPRTQGTGSAGAPQDPGSIGNSGEPRKDPPDSESWGNFGAAPGTDPFA